MWIRTLPVYSKLADESDVPSEVAERLPAGWRLSQHQVETYKALTGGEYDVVFNTAMTGDGKSLAAYLPTLVSGHPVLAMYPTNELARDQETQLLTFEARDGTTGCIAFAREALLLSVALKERRVTCGGGAMIV